MNTKNKSIKRRLRNSYVITLLSITLVLFVLSVFFSLSLYAKNITSYIKENIGFEIIFKKSVKEKDILEFQKTLDAKKYVKSTKYISKEEATKQLSDDLGEDVLEWLGDVENPLLPSIDVHFTSDYANNDSIAKIEQWVTKNKIVKEVNFQKSLVGSITNNINKLRVVLVLVCLLLLVMAVTLISNTVRLSIYSKRFVVRSMQLVGATRNFIMKPFMKTFVIQGFIGSVLALALLTVSLLAIMKNVPELKQITNMSGIVIIYVSTILLGVILAILATFFATRKYLDANVDELYE